MKIAISKFLIGKMIFETKKSVKSKILRPKIQTSPNELYVNVEGIEAINRKIPMMTVIFARLIFHFSMMAATIISYILNDEVNVANKNRIKNSAKNSSPNGICENAAGNTMNNNGGPLATSISK